MLKPVQQLEVVRSAGREPRQVRAVGQRASVQRRVELSCRLPEMPRPGVPGRQRRATTLPGLDQARVHVSRRIPRPGPSGTSTRRAALVEEALDGATAALTVVAGQLVDVHPDETVGQVAIQTSVRSPSRSPAPHGGGPARSRCSRPGWRSGGRMASVPRSLRTTLPPSGSGRPPVRSPHHTPRSTTSVQVVTRVGQLTLVDDQPGVGLDPRQRSPGCGRRAPRRARKSRSRNSRRARKAEVSVPGTATLASRQPPRELIDSTAPRPRGRSRRPCWPRRASTRSARSNARRRGC